MTMDGADDSRMRIGRLAQIALAEDIDTVEEKSDKDNNKTHSKEGGVGQSVNELKEHDAQ
jgi:hypothetical protein